jgi:hypothetical protein
MLQDGSPAIDRGSSAQGSSADIFNKKRPAGAQADIGAHEK